MRLLLENHQFRSKCFCEIAPIFTASGVLLSIMTEKLPAFLRLAVDSVHFYGILSLRSQKTVKALVSNRFRLARFLLKPLGSLVKSFN
jgi:hypothetical protein